MAKIGRNAPCPCGSGKKYKKCCLSADEEAARRSRPPMPPPPGFVWEEDPLDKLSNRVVDLIEAGRLDEADAVCDQLAAEYPDMIDPIERRAMVLEARGDAAAAAHHYRLAADYARTHEGFEPDSVTYYVDKARELAGAQT